MTRRTHTRRTARLGIALTVLAAAAMVGCTPGGGGPYGSRGPMAVRVTQEAVTTFYHPATMAAGRTYPVILWGNGTFTQPSWYDELLRHWASHGFIVAAANTSNAGSGQEMLAGLDNLTTKNSTPGNPFYQRVDLTRVGASGHSQGGAGTMRAAKDPRVKTAFPIEGPGSPQGIHGPVIFFAGENDTALAQASLRAFEALGAQPGAYAELAGATHLTALGGAGGFRAATTAWALWQLKGDTTARGQFVGSACGLCTSNAWSRYQANQLS